MMQGIYITLADNAKALEVVVAGYGTQRKSDLTGSVVAAKDFNQGNVNTPEQLIVGKVPGVQITTNGGATDSGSRIHIRGRASLNANNDPLIVIAELNKLKLVQLAFKTEDYVLNFCKYCTVVKKIAKW